MWEVVGLLVSRSCVGQSVGWWIRASVLFCCSVKVVLDAWLVDTYKRLLVYRDTVGHYLVLDGGLLDVRASVAPRQTPTLPTPQLE